MGVGIGLFTPCSQEAFKERLETADIKRRQEEDRASRPRKSDTHRCAVMRRLEDRKLAKSLGLTLADLE